MSVKTKLICWMFRLLRLPTCEEVERFAYDFLDRQLDPAMQRAVERHLKACKNCHRFIAAYRAVADGAKQLPTPPLDPEFTTALREFLRTGRPDE